MKTLNRKISGPIIALFVIVPILIMVIFNVSARFYVNRATAQELTNVVANVKNLAETLSEKDLTEPELSDESLKRLLLIRSALQVSKYSMNTEIVIVNDNGKVIFPQSYTDSFLSDALIEKAQLRLTQEDTIQRFISAGKVYMMIGETVEGPYRSYDVFFIASAASSDALIRFMNLILVIVLVVSTAAAIGITVSLSKKISAPLVSAAAATHRVAKGDYGIIQADSDTLEIRQLIDGMNAMSAKLKASEDSQRDFLQNASHELRTPLMSIQGYAEGLSQGIFSQAKETADLIAQESRRLNALVEELLTLSRMESGNIELVLEPLNLCEALQDYIQRANGYALMEKKQIRLDIRQSPLTVSVDEDLLFKAVYNILTNAVKYAKSTVTVTLAQEQDNALILIEDDGEGISTKDLPHVFKRFYKGKKGNFGLGLAIAKTSIELMNGTVEVTNATGARFIIRLPKP